MAKLPSWPVTARHGPDIAFLGVARCDWADPPSYPGADVVILGAPFDGGTSYRSGARFGPQYIRQTCYLPHDGSPGRRWFRLGTPGAAVPDSSAWYRWLPGRTLPVPRWRTWRCPWFRQTLARSHPPAKIPCISVIRTIRYKPVKQIGRHLRLIDLAGYVATGDLRRGQNKCDPIA